MSVPIKKHRVYVCEGCGKTRVGSTLKVPLGWTPSKCNTCQRKQLDARRPKPEKLNFYL